MDTILLVGGLAVAFILLYGGWLWVIHKLTGAPYKEMFKWW